MLSKKCNFINPNKQTIYYSAYMLLLFGLFSCSAQKKSTSKDPINKEPFPTVFCYFIIPTTEQLDSTLSNTQDIKLQNDTMYVLLNMNSAQAQLDTVAYSKELLDNMSECFSDGRNGYYQFDHGCPEVGEYARKLYDLGGTNDILNNAISLVDLDKGKIVDRRTSREESYDYPPLEDVLLWNNYTRFGSTQFDSLTTTYTIASIDRNKRVGKRTRDKKNQFYFGGGNDINELLGYIENKTVVLTETEADELITQLKSTHSDKIFEKHHGIRFSNKYQDETDFGKFKRETELLEADYRVVSYQYKASYQGFSIGTVLSYDNDLIGKQKIYADKTCYNEKQIIEILRHNIEFRIRLGETIKSEKDEKKKTCPYVFGVDSYGTNNSIDRYIGHLQDDIRTLNEISLSCEVTTTSSLTTQCFSLNTSAGTIQNLEGCDDYTISQIDIYDATGTLVHSEKNPSSGYSVLNDIGTKTGMFIISITNVHGEKESYPFMKF